MKIFVYAELNETARSLLTKKLAHMDVIFASKSDLVDRREEFSQCEIAFGNVPAGWLDGPFELQWLQLESIGFEYYRSVAGQIAARGMHVTNLKGMFTYPAAETALAGILALYRGMNELVRVQLDQHWIELELRPKLRILHGRKAVVCGLGAIGTHIKNLLVAFGCEVIGFARTSPDAQLHTRADLDAILPTIDLVINSLPNTLETSNLFDRDRLSRFADGGVFVNVGRGSAVDETALVDALTTGKLGGAVLDVFTKEPLPRDHPLWYAPNTLITQHTGGGYDRELVDKAEFFLKNLQNFLCGRPLLNEIDINKGY